MGLDFYRLADYIVVWHWGMEIVLCRICMLKVYIVCVISLEMSNKLWKVHCSLLGGLHGLLNHYLQVLV